MRKISTATAVLGAVAALLTTTGATTAALGYDARAKPVRPPHVHEERRHRHHRRTIVLDNTRSARRAQFKVVRDGDRFADPTVLRSGSPAHGRKSVTASVPQRTTASVRVRVPEMGREELRLSTTVAVALASRYVATVKPKASLGGVSCHGKDRSP